MRMKKAILLLFLLAGCLFHGMAQFVALTVTTNDGVEQTYQLTHEGQLYFVDGNRLVIEDGVGTTATYQLSNLRKLVCTEYANVDETSATTPLILPNPVRDNFLITNLQEACEARIYALDGRLVKSLTATDGMRVDISDLAPGMYLLNIECKTIKMMKL